MPISLNPGDRVVDFYHGDGIPNFAAMVADGAVAVWLKASEGTTDYVSWLKQVIPVAIAAGLTVGIYHFVNPLVSAASQIATFWNASLGWDFPLSYCLDCEPRKSPKGGDEWNQFSGNQASSFVRQLVGELRDYGIEVPVVYASPSFWQEKICNPCDAVEDQARADALKGCAAWLAEYGKPSDFVPKNLESFEGDTPWLYQYTETGVIGGFHGADISRVLTAEAA